MNEKKEFKTLERTTPIKDIKHIMKTAEEGDERSKDFYKSPPMVSPSLHQIFVKPKLREFEAIDLLNKKVSKEIEIRDVKFVYKSAVIGGCLLRFMDGKKKIDEQTEKVFILFPDEDTLGINWDDAETLSGFDDLDNSPAILNRDKGPYYSKVSDQLFDVKKFRQVRKDFSDWLYYNSRLPIQVHPDLGVFQIPGEDEREFFIRLRQAARERRDDEIESIEKKYRKQLDRLEKKMAKMERELFEDEEMYRARKREEMIEAGESILSFFLGRRRTRDASTIARRRRLTSKAKMDIEETKEELSELDEEIQKLENELKKVTDEIVKDWEEVTDELEREELKPRRSEVNVKLIALAWVPHWYLSYNDGVISRDTTFPAHLSNLN